MKTYSKIYYQCSTDDSVQWQRKDLLRRIQMLWLLFASFPAM